MASLNNFIKKSEAGILSTPETHSIVMAASTWKRIHKLEKIPLGSYNGYPIVINDFIQPNDICIIPNKKLKEIKSQDHIK